MIFRIALRTLPALIAAILAAACTAPSTDAPVATPATPPAATPGVPDANIPSPAPIEPAAGTPPASQDAPALALEAEGLRLFNVQTGAATPLAFGLEQQQLLGSLERFKGAAVQGTNEDCGAGPVQVANWPDGLSLVFQDGRFVGWGADGRAQGGLTTAVGIGPGSTRAELVDAYANVTPRNTTLGTEFDVGGLHGLLDGTAPSAKITYFWAGVSCAAR